MKKTTRFILAALLLVSVMLFASCGSKDDNNDAIPDDQQSGIQQDIDNGADDIRNDADRIGDGIDDAADDVRDAVDGHNNGNDINRGDVSENTADNGTRSNVQ